MSFVFIFYSEYKENIYNISKDDYAKLYKSCCLPTEIMKKKFVILNESYAKILHMVVKIEGHKIKSVHLSLSLSLSLSLILFSLSLYCYILHHTKVLVLKYSIWIKAIVT